MKRFIVGFSLLAASVAHAGEVTGYLQGEGTLFFEEPLHKEQEPNAFSVAGEVEWYQEFDGGSSFTATFFGRGDAADDGRTHADVREFNYLHVGDGWEVKVGVSKVFWGVTEFAHLVDIVNQTDSVESLDGEEKLGQPMVHLSIPTGGGVFNFFVLPGFRERTFPGAKGRLRIPLVVDTDHPTYESPDKERHIDYAFRYSRSVGDWEVGLSHFWGTSREPRLIFTPTDGAPVLRPSYPIINQTGLDLLYIAGDWIWKLETIYRNDDLESYTAADVGFEYSFYGIFESDVDLGVILEYLHDSRGDEATTPYNHDVTLGMRLAMNDVASSDLLVGWIQDSDSSARMILVEGSRRFGDAVRASIEGGAFLDAPEDEPTYGFRQDSYLKVESTFYF